MTHERARKNLQIIFRGLDAIGLEQAGKTLGVSTGTVSKMKAEESKETKTTFPKLAALMTEMGYKIVPETWMCVDPETFQMLWTGHKKYMELVKSPEQLLFEDPE